MKVNSIFLLLAGFFLLTGLLAAAEVSVYGHISFVDNGVTVLRADGSKDQAVVNLPLAPGDTVITSGGGRCELQFDNGTVVRLDKGSRLRLATVLAPSLTSNWQITTLELGRGQLYTLPQSYSREMFQVVTPNAAASLKNRVRAYIRLDDTGGTSFFSDGGKFQVLFGADNRSLKRAKVKSNRPMAITAAHVPAAQVEKRDIEFMAWNEYVDRHFKELHYGISKVPANFTKFKNKALLYWAEKWSSCCGEWIYDDLFGYVWRPADEQFAFSSRPFFHADFVRIDGRLFLVPREQWGWVPAHMGTWVWLKRGWTWIPGDWFHPGIVDFQGTHVFPTIYYYCHMFDANIFAWPPSGPAGEPAWPDRPPKKPELPEPVITLVKKVIKAPDGNESKRLATGKAGGSIDGAKLPSTPKPGLQPPAAGAVVKAGAPPAQKSGGASGRAGEFRLARDWNPDSRWASRSGRTIRYSSSRNAVVCPELKISSDRLRGVERVMFRDSAVGVGQGYAPGGSSAQPASSADGSGMASGAGNTTSGAGTNEEIDGSGEGR